MTLKNGKVTSRTKQRFSEMENLNTDVEEEQTMLTKVFQQLIT